MVNLQSSNDSDDSDDDGGLPPPPPQPPHLTLPPPPTFPYDLTLFPGLSQNTLKITQPNKEIDPLEEMGMLKEKVVIDDKLKN